MKKFRFTSLTDSLPSTVPFVGPETQERQNKKVFKARLGLMKMSLDHPHYALKQ